MFYHDETECLRNQSKCRYDISLAALEQRSFAQESRHQSGVKTAIPDTKYTHPIQESALLSIYIALVTPQLSGRSHCLKSLSRHPPVHAPDFLLPRKGLGTSAACPLSPDLGYIHCRAFPQQKETIVAVSLPGFAVPNFRQLRHWHLKLSHWQRSA